MPGRPKSLPLFRLRSDCNNFADFITDDIDALHKLRRSASIRKKWKGLPGFAGVSSDRPLGDFAGFTGTDSLVAVNSRTWGVLRLLVGDAAELLPLGTQSGEEYFVLHVVRFVDALDLDRAIVRRTPNGNIYGVSKYAFEPGLVDGLHLFNVPEAMYEPPLVSDQVRKAVKDAKLKGAHFSPIVQ
jgi:Immunity protein family (Imm11)